MTHRGDEDAGWRKYITITSGVIGGKPRVSGTRIPVELILGYLAAGYIPDAIIKEFPDLKREQIEACAKYQK